MYGDGCDGKLYHLKSGVWQGIASHPGYAGLPSNVTYKSLSRLSSGVGATFHTGSSIWLAGRGSWSPQGTTWTPPVQLPSIKNSAGTTLTPYRVGGQYVITSAGNGICSAATDSCDGDADRVYFYDLGTGSWKRFTGGLPWYPSEQVDIAECTLSDDACDPNQTPSAACGQCVRLYPYYDGITQVGGDFALHHRYSWVWRWRK